MYLIGFIGFLGSTIGISIGGILAMLASEFKQDIAMIYALCSGLIIGLIGLEIVPESLHQGQFIPFIMGILAGGILYELIDRVFDSFDILHVKTNGDGYIRTGIVLAISIAIHNFPMGMAFGAGQHGIMHNSILQTILLHNIPEGIALFTPFILAKLNWKALLFFAVVISLPIAFGAILGSMIDMSYPNLWSVVTGLAVGILTFVTIQEIFGAAIKRSSLLRSVMMAGIGFSVIWLYLNLF
ncbi:ZIP family metal transporter [Lysinibacillus sp. 54212]|uniref:ZIP family metal transporter n=1 Tax=Lysinibacillus sp. 54212 TaxID=3119829 RepID=UPI002FC67D7F